MSSLNDEYLQKDYKNKKMSRPEHNIVMASVQQRLYTQNTRLDLAP